MFVLPFDLVGSNVGDIAVWEASCRERIVHKAFKPFNLPACSMVLQSILAKESGVSVNRVLWNPDGTQFGVAYSRHLVQLFNCNGRKDLVHHLEEELMTLLSLNLITRDVL